MLLLGLVFGGWARLRFDVLFVVTFVFALVGLARPRFFSGEIALIRDRMFSLNFMFLLRSRVCCALSCLVIFDACLRRSHSGTFELDSIRLVRSSRSRDSSESAELSGSGSLNSLSLDGPSFEFAGGKTRRDDPTGSSNLSCRACHASRCFMTKGRWVLAA
jgi:hypothetical protein